MSIADEAVLYDVHKYAAIWVTSRPGLHLGLGYI